MAMASGQKYKSSNIKYVGLLREPNLNEPQPPSTYWKQSNRDYSKLMARLNAQRIDR